MKVNIFHNIAVSRQVIGMSISVSRQVTGMNIAVSRPVTGKNIYACTLECSALMLAHLAKICETQLRPSTSLPQQHIICCHALLWQLQRLAEPPRCRH